MIEAGNISIKQITEKDIPTWMALSAEYDNYIKELVHDLTQWYEGNETDIAFFDYMKAKIVKREALMAIDKNTRMCLGVIAFSRKNNRITFFGISHNTQDYNLVGEILMKHALCQLNSCKEVAITVLKSNAQQIERERELLKKFGFIYFSDELENGVPVDKMLRQALLQDAF